MNGIGLLSLESCCGILKMINSVLEGLWDKKLEDMQLDALAIVSSKWVLLGDKFKAKMIREVEYHQHIDDGLLMNWIWHYWEEWCIKSRGPRTDPSGTQSQIGDPLSALMAQWYTPVTQLCYKVPIRTYSLMNSHVFNLYLFFNLSVFIEHYYEKSTHFASLDVQIMSLWTQRHFSMDW